MSPHELIYTALLLGVFVLCAGAYAVLHALGRVQSLLPTRQQVQSLLPTPQQVRRAPRLFAAARFCFALQTLTCALIVLSTALGFGWKLLLCVSCLATMRIPQVTWRYLDFIHAHR